MTQDKRAGNDVTLGPIPVGALTSGEEAMLRAWAESYASRKVAAERERCAQLIEPKNDRSDWTECAHHAARLARRVRLGA